MRGRLPQGEPGVVVVIGSADDKVAVVAALTDEAQARGLSANDLVRAVGPLVGGKGGGKADVAQGGGTDVSRIDEALALVDGRGRPERAEPEGCGPAYGSGSIRATLGSVSPAATRPASSPRPVETVHRGKGDLRRIAQILAEEQAESEVVEVVVGLPRSLSGGEGPAAVKVRTSPPAWLPGSHRSRCGSSTSG